MKKISTYDLILEESQEQFNNHGVESVSINRMATALNISTGNFTYHFKRKKDIISKHMTDLESELMGVIGNLPEHMTAREFLDIYFKGLKTTFDYRFLFNCASYLIESELLIAAEYKNMLEHVTSTVTEQVKNLIDQGYMKDIPAPNNTEILVDCITLQWLGWLNTNQLREVDDRIPYDELLMLGLRYCVFVVLPYIDSQFRNQINKELMAMDKQLTFN